MKAKMDNIFNFEGPGAHLVAPRAPEPNCRGKSVKTGIKDL